LFDTVLDVGEMISDLFYPGVYRQKTMDAENSQ
jgi:hypothetical protein